MGFSLLPDIQTASVTDLTPDVLRTLHVTALLLDFDNTIVPYTTSRPAEAVSSWLAQMQRSGIRLCVVSNSRKDRVRQFCGARGLPCVRRAGKPSVRGLREAMELLGAGAEETAMVGDQIYTDVLAGNRAGVLSILVIPLELSNGFLKARHVLEKPWIAAAKRRRLP